MSSAAWHLIDLVYGLQDALLSQHIGAGYVVGKLHCCRVGAQPRKHALDILCVGVGLLQSVSLAASTAGTALCSAAPLHW